MSEANREVGRDDRASNPGKGNPSLKGLRINQRQKSTQNSSNQAIDPQQPNQDPKPTN
jgi:hypothetical protein